MKKTFFLILLFSFLSFSLFAEVSTDYGYRKLDKEEKAFYKDLDKVVSDDGTKVEDVQLTQEEALKVYSVYLDDHPGVFWLEHMISFQVLKQGDTVSDVNVLLTYTDPDNLKKDRKWFTSEMEAWHKEIKKEKSDWDKLLKIYTLLATTITYDSDYRDQSLWTVIRDQTGVCAGIARAFQYLALQEGIPCIVVRGNHKEKKSSKGTVDHMWCMAKVKGRWYHFDPTWGLAENKKEVNYSFFCCSDSVIERTHRIDNTYSVPSASSDKLSYLSVKGWSFGKFDEEKVKDAIEKALRDGEKNITLEFKSTKELKKAVKALKEGSLLSQVFSDLKRKAQVYYYAPDERNYTLSLKF